MDSFGHGQSQAMSSVTGPFRPTPKYIPDAHVPTERENSWAGVPPGSPRTSVVNGAERVCITVPCGDYRRVVVEPKVGSQIADWKAVVRGGKKLHFSVLSETLVADGSGYGAGERVRASMVAGSCAVGRPITIMLDSRNFWSDPRRVDVYVQSHAETEPWKLRYTSKACDRFSESFHASYRPVVSDEPISMMTGSGY
jgi:hypothetical protein